MGGLALLASRAWLWQRRHPETRKASSLVADRRRHPARSLDAAGATLFTHDFGLRRPRLVGAPADRRDPEIVRFADVDGDGTLEVLVW